jgi:hypothetical protein
MHLSQKAYEPNVDGVGANVVSIIDAIHRSGFEIPLYLRRNSWGPMTVFRFTHTTPSWEIWRVNSAPYFCNYPAKIVPIVHGIVHWGQHHQYEVHTLRCPGTFAYTPIRRPAWWRDDDAPLIST